jgi:hypothetical protein
MHNAFWRAAAALPQQQSAAAANGPRAKKFAVL